MMKLNWRRALAAIVVSTMAITAVPGIVFAEEIEVAPEEAIVVESEETDQVVFDEEETVEVEETDETAENAEEAVAADPIEEENVGAGPAPAEWSKAIPYTIGKTVSGATHPSSWDADLDNQGKYYKWAFYKFSVNETGYYKFVSNSDDKLKFIVTNNENFMPYNAYSSWKNSTITFETAEDTAIEKDLGLQKGSELWLVVDGRVNDTSL